MVDFCGTVHQDTGGYSVLNTGKVSIRGFKNVTCKNSFYVWNCKIIGVSGEIT